MKQRYSCMKSPGQILVYTVNPNNSMTSRNLLIHDNSVKTIRIYATNSICYSWKADLNTWDLKTLSLQLSSEELRTIPQFSDFIVVLVCFLVFFILTDIAPGHVFLILPLLTKLSWRWFTLACLPTCFSMFSSINHSVSGSFVHDW